MRNSPDSPRATTSSPWRSTATTPVAASVRGARRTFRLSQVTAPFHGNSALTADDWASPDFGVSWAEAAPSPRPRTTETDSRRRANVDMHSPSSGETFLSPPPRGLSYPRGACETLALLRGRPRLRGVPPLGLAHELGRAAGLRLDQLRRFLALDVAQEVVVLHFGRHLHGVFDDHDVGPVLPVVAQHRAGDDLDLGRRRIRVRFEDPALDLLGQRDRDQPRLRVRRRLGHVGGALELDVGPGAQARDLRGSLFADAGLQLRRQPSRALARGAALQLLADLLADRGGQVGLVPLGPLVEPQERESLLGPVDLVGHLPHRRLQRPLQGIAVSGE